MRGEVDSESANTRTMHLPQVTDFSYVLAAQSTTVKDIGGRRGRRGGRCGGRCCVRLRVLTRLKATVHICNYMKNMLFIIRYVGKYSSITFTCQRLHCSVTCSLTVML